MTDAASKPATWGGLTLWSWAVLFSAVALVYRLWFCTHFDLVGDEAYYWLLSHRLDMSYFDKGPGVAWTIAASRQIFGDTVFGVRFFAVLLSVATGWWMFLLARRLFDERVALGALVLTCIIPLFAVGSILMTIDPLSVFFWTTAAYAFWVAQESDRVGPWLLTGALVGLGALCKYINLFQLLCFIIFLAIDPTRRKRLLTGTICRHDRRRAFALPADGCLEHAARLGRPAAPGGARRDRQILAFLGHRAAGLSRPASRRDQPDLFHRRADRRLQSRRGRDRAAWPRATCRRSSFRSS